MCGQGQGVSEGALRGSSRWARAAAPGRREFKTPASQRGPLAWVIMAADADHTLLPSKSPRCAPLSGGWWGCQACCLVLLALRSRGGKLGIGPWRPGCQPCVILGRSVDLLGPCVLIAKFRAGARRPQAALDPHGGQPLLWGSLPQCHPVLAQSLGVATGPQLDC